MRRAADQDPYISLVCGTQEVINYLLLGRQRRLACIQVFRVHWLHQAISSDPTYGGLWQRSIPLWRGVSSDMGVVLRAGGLHSCATWKTKAWQRHFPHGVLASRRLRCCTVFGRDTMPYAGVACRRRRRDSRCSGSSRGVYQCNHVAVLSLPKMPRPTVPPSIINRGVGNPGVS
jgi:hypothetical protein